MKTKPILLATSPTLEGITTMIRKYFYSTEDRIVSNEDDFETSSPMFIARNGKIIGGHQVRFIKGRYRFECLP